jgi:tight adherence protein C
VTVLVAASLAALSSALALGAFVTRQDGSLLARLPSLARARAHRSPLAAVGSLPLVRQIGLRASARRRLEASGDPWSEREVVGAKVVSCGAAASLCALAGAWALALPLIVLAARLPDVWLSRLSARRLAAADREVPVLLDMLALATSAGLPPQGALRRAIDATEGPLADELGAVVRATDLGGRWRDELGAAARRLGLPDLDRTVGALTRAEALGSSLAEEMERLAADVREGRRAGATERARAAPVKMLFPLVFLILPAFLLLTVVPVLVATVESIR